MVLTDEWRLYIRSNHSNSPVHADCLCLIALIAALLATVLAWSIKRARAFLRSLWKKEKNETSGHSVGRFLDVLNAAVISANIRTRRNTWQFCSRCLHLLYHQVPFSFVFLQARFFGRFLPRFRGLIYTQGCRWILLFLWRGPWATWESSDVPEPVWGAYEPYQRSRLGSEFSPRARRNYLPPTQSKWRGMRVWYSFSNFMVFCDTHFALHGYGLVPAPSNNSRCVW